MPNGGLGEVEQVQQFVGQHHVDPGLGPPRVHVTKHVLRLAHLLVVGEVPRALHHQLRRVDPHGALAQLVRGQHARRPPVPAPRVDGREGALRLDAGAERDVDHLLHARAVRRLHDHVAPVGRPRVVHLHGRVANGVALAAEGRGGLGLLVEELEVLPQRRLALLGRAPVESKRVARLALNGHVRVVLLLRPLLRHDRRHGLHANGALALGPPDALARRLLCLLGLFSRLRRIG
mmetsp:Transcript_21268/g.52355  ORF Transcript_21268/g.52355 Transcript_21268/m.52355 type:complete len:234 (-) Transcript_21268:290-991(-)